MNHRNERSSLPAVPQTEPVISDLATYVSEEEAQKWSRFHNTTYRQKWCVWFKDVGLLPSLPRPVFVMFQSTSSPLYRAEGRLRPSHAFCVFYYTVSGRGVFWDSQGEHVVTAGQGFLFEASDRTTGYYYPSDCVEPWVSIAFGFGGSSSEVILRDLRARFGSVYDIDPSSKVIECLLTYEDYQPKVASAEPTVGAQMVWELISCLVAAGQARTEGNPRTGVVARAKRLMSADPHQKITIALVARELGMSREHFTRWFTKHSGESPGEFLHKSRIEFAASLLKTSALSVKQIAHRAGYHDQHSFSKSFHRHMGTTPSEYRLARG